MSRSREQEDDGCNRAGYARRNAGSSHSLGGLQSVSGRSRSFVFLIVNELEQERCTTSLSPEYAVVSAYVQEPKEEKQNETKSNKNRQQCSTNEQDRNFEESVSKPRSLMQVIRCEIVSV